MQIPVTSTTEPAGELITLTETGPQTAEFTGTLMLSTTDAAGVLQVTEGDTLTATYIDADDGHHLRVIAGGKNLVGGLEVAVMQRGLRHGNAGLAQQPDDPLARKPVEERPVRLRREHDTVFRHEDIGGGKFCDIAEHVADDAIGEGAHLRPLAPADLDAFAALLAAFDFRYAPPHPLDGASAARALRRASYLPFGVFRENALIGYVLVRLFFPRRAVSGYWLLAAYHDTGVGVAAARAMRELLRAAALPDYVTIPLDNAPSLVAARAAGWRILRSNRRFHVLRR